MDDKLIELIIKFKNISDTNSNLSNISNMHIYYLKIKIINMYKTIIYCEQLINLINTI